MKRTFRLLAAVVLLFLWFSIFFRFEPVALPNSSSISSAWLPLTTDDSSANQDTLDDECVFRTSSLYRKVYVYPSPGEPEWRGSILSNESNNNTSFPQYPWDQVLQVIRREAREQYYPHSMTAQFSTELIVHDLLRNSCLRTYDPEEAELFLVPYLPSVEFHAGVRGKPPSHATSPYAQAILNILDSPEQETDSAKYAAWEKQFGLTSHYWKRRGGADHILIFSEPLQGLTHPKGKRGSYHFIHTQRQLDPPIVLSVELSTSFVQKYPACSRKNILLPYPVTDGNQFNGEMNRIAIEVMRNYSLNIQHNDDSSSASSHIQAAAFPHEVSVPEGRPFAYWLKAGIHGACVPLRQAMNRDYKHCSPSFLPLRQQLQQPYWITMRLATFCPCPGGDTASAKRMFDAIFSGCIPVILSHDFVWPFSAEILPKENEWRLDPSEFSLRWNASEYEHEHYNATCHGYGLEERLQEVTAEQISSLRRGMERAARMFRYWEPSDELPFNVLHHGVPPNGGAVEVLVKQLEERAAGRLWPACREELERLREEDAIGNDPTEFVC
ncbi:hypothetical protein FisN_2Hh454 [Fistulifera solaris]|jgi:hypothetical protein|uniref:Exostosin GT47 domain-containing protein n=1 Tax=Fistulifera solaris TaxID=1519565 RepID=A0A1Z5JGS0_FISSO|nr:hypothetical protein FisN_2Hh454 [Fistulifera solaris]|eukprot:GAX12961.1 hypothetical protein FisN_2Hh454 [Fistulifera solaris]